MKKLKGVIWICVAALFAVFLAEGVPYYIRKIPWKYEKRLSDRWKPELDLCPTSPALQKISLAIGADSQIEVTIARGDTINAFAFLGGKIYIYDGLLREAQSPEEIAGVLAHEIVHVKRRHVIEGLGTRLLTFASFQMIFDTPAQIGVEVLRYALGMSFTRAQESQADDDALARLQEFSVSTKGYADFFKRSESVFLSDHPSNSERVKKAEAAVVSQPKQVLSADEWASLKKICR